MQPDITGKFYPRGRNNEMFPMITFSRFSKLNYKIVDFIHFACKFHVSGIFEAACGCNSSGDLN